MLKITKLLALFAVIATLFSFRPAPASFTGNWMLNEGKSELGQFGARAAPSKISVDQGTDQITISRTATNFQGEVVTYSESLGFDGKEKESTLFGSAKKKSSLKWAADQQTFVITYKLTFGSGDRTFELNGTETWSVSADGKSITVVNSGSTPQGDFTTKTVFDKQ